MVEVVFQEVVFGQVGDVAGLDGGEEVDVGGVGGEGDDVDHFGGLGGGGIVGRVVVVSSQVSWRD